MTYIQSVILGITQGLTEFLPISSSGHLFVVFLLFGFVDTLSEELYLLYSILLHGATLCAVVIFSRKVIWNIIISCTKSTICVIKGTVNRKQDRAYVKLAFMVFVSTITTAPMALIVYTFFKNVTQALVMSGFFITIVFLLLPTFLKSYIFKNTIQKPKDDVVQKIEDMPLGKVTYIAFILGLVQGIAVFPGISRSGSTIVVGIILGFTFLQSARYSFLLAIPAILSAVVLSLINAANLPHTISTGIVIVGMASAFISGLVGLVFLSLLAKKQRLWYFALYLGLLEVVLFFI